MDWRRGVTEHSSLCWLLRSQNDHSNESPGPEPVTVSEYASKLRNNLKSAYECVHDKMGRTLDRQKNIYDQKVHGKPIDKGDLVWLHCPVVPRCKSKKLHWPWSRPFRVVSKLSYRIQNMTACRQHFVVRKLVSTRHIIGYGGPSTHTEWAKATC